LYENAAPQKKIIIRTVATLTAGFFLTTMMPNALIKWFVVGCAADYCFRTATGGKTNLLGLIADFGGAEMSNDSTMKSEKLDTNEKPSVQHVEDVKTQTKKQ
jgi:hypothetical protein